MRRVVNFDGKPLEEIARILKGDFSLWRYVPRERRSLQLVMDAMTASLQHPCSVKSVLDVDEWREYVKSKDFIVTVVTIDPSARSTVVEDLLEEHYSDMGFISRIILSGVSADIVRVTAIGLKVFGVALRDTIENAREQYMREESNNAKMLGM